jgi:hypothetical protein
MYRAKKDGKRLNSHKDLCTAKANKYTLSRPRPTWMEAPLGPLDDSAREHIENGKLESRLFCQRGNGY